MSNSDESRSTKTVVAEKCVSETIGETMNLRSGCEHPTIPGKDIEVEATGGIGDDGKSEEDDGLPIDRGWAWMILAGSFLNVILMIGYARSTGILFVEYLEIFEASTTKTTLFMGVMSATFSISSLLSMNLLLQILGVRKLVLLGGAISSLGMLTAVFATSITFLICTHSILIGLGHPMIHGPALVLIGQYFKKRRGLATALSMSGFSLGASIFPPLIRYFIDEYGIRGSMLLITGMTMNMLVGALLYRPIESFRRQRKKNETKPLMTLDIDSNKKHDIHTSSEALNNHLLCGETEGKNQTFNSVELAGSQLELYRSNLDLASVSMLDIPDYGSERTTMPKNRKTLCDYLKMMIKALDFALFKHPMFQLIAVTSVFASVFGVVTVYLPALAKEKGVPATEASILLTIFGCVDFVSRLTVGYIADLKRIKIHHLIAIGLIMSGTVAHFASLHDSFALMVVFSVLVGLFGSFYNCLIPVIIVEFMGQEHMAKVLGFVLVIIGLSVSLTHPIMGAIRDLTGSYSICFNYIGTAVYIAAICLLCEPLVRRRARKLHLMDHEEGHKGVEDG